MNKLTFKKRINAMNKLTDMSWLWIISLIDLAISMGLARLLVQNTGWRYSLGMSTELDASNSIFAYTSIFGVVIPIIILFGTIMLCGLVHDYKRKKIN